MDDDEVSYSSSDADDSVSDDAGIGAFAGYRSLFTTSLEWCPATRVLGCGADGADAPAVAGDGEPALPLPPHTTLWLGGADVLATPKWLRDHSIAVVINAASLADTRELDPGFRATAGVTDVTVLGMSDFSAFAGARDAILRGAAALDDSLRAGRSTYVHCLMGMSRSVSVVLAYLVVHRRVPLAVALALVRARRPIAYPNLGFLLHLIDIETEALGAASIPPGAARALHREAD